MKKFFALFLLFIFALSLYSAPAGGGMRVDIVSFQMINETSADKSVHIGRRKRKSKGKDIHDIFFSKADLTGDGAQATVM